MYLIFLLEEGGEINVLSCYSVLFPELFFCTHLCGIPAITTQITDVEKPLIYTRFCKRHIHNIFRSKLEYNIKMDK
jgi:hypothetical protein